MSRQSESPWRCQQGGASTNGTWTHPLNKEQNGVPSGRAGKLFYGKAGVQAPPFRSPPTEPALPGHQYADCDADVIQPDIRPTALAVAPFLEEKLAEFARESVG